MKKNKLFIVGAVAFCLLLVQNAAADSVIKTLYVDGSLVQEVNDPCDGLTWPSTMLTIGAEGSQGYMYNEFVGKMDEFAVYSGVLSSSRVAAHYAAKDSNNAYTAAVAADAPKLWLKFNDASTANGQTALNSGSATGKNGSYIVNGTGSISQVAGFVTDSCAIEFIGRTPDAPGNCISVDDAAGDFAEQTNGDVSIEFWTSFTDPTDYERFFQHNANWESPGGYGLLVVLPTEPNGEPTQLAVVGGARTDYMPLPETVDINDGQWHHIVVTYDSTYIPIPPPLTLSYPEEVNKDNPVLWLRFEDTQPKDYSVLDGNHWVGYSPSTSILERVGGIGKSAYVGNLGTSAYAAAAKNDPNAPVVPYQTFDNNYAFAPNDITFEIWYKSNPPGTQPQPDIYAYFFQQSGVWTRNNGPGAGNSSGQVVLLTGTPWWTGIPTKFDGEWHQLVVTYDENDVDPCNVFIQLYTDGTIKATRSVRDPNALGPEMSHILLGSRNDIGYTYNVFAGYMDEFAIYKGILDPNRIMVHYSAWQPKNCAEMMSRNQPIGADWNEDCKVNFEDFAEFALEWAKCNDPKIGAPRCPPNW